MRKLFSTLALSAAAGAGGCASWGWEAPVAGWAIAPCECRGSVVASAGPPPASPVAAAPARNIGPDDLAPVSFPELDASDDLAPVSFSELATDDLARASFPRDETDDDLAPVVFSTRPVRARSTR